MLSSYSRVQFPAEYKSSILVGAGDSYAAAETANYLASMRHTVMNPYELIAAPSLAKGKAVFFISVSGTTISNVTAAKAAKGIASRTTAITSNPKGRLAGATDSAIIIPYNGAPRMPGTLSFSLSLLALLKLTGTRTFGINYRGLLSKAARLAENVRFSDGGVTFFLGNYATYPICLYACMKAFEITGERARASRLEEFSHAQIFELRRKDSVNILGGFDDLRLGRRLAKGLVTHGFIAARVYEAGLDERECVFLFTFATQLAVLERARASGLTGPYFVRARRKLALSDAMIYEGP